MKVKELIARLSAYDRDLEVVIYEARKRYVSDSYVDIGLVVAGHDKKGVYNNVLLYPGINWRHFI